MGAPSPKEGRPWCSSGPPEEGLLACPEPRLRHYNPPGVAGHVGGIRGPAPGAKVEARACRSAG